MKISCHNGYFCIFTQLLAQAMSHFVFFDKIFTSFHFYIQRKQGEILKINFESPELQLVIQKEARICTTFINRHLEFREQYLVIKDTRFTTAALDSVPNTESSDAVGKSIYKTCIFLVSFSIFTFYNIYIYLLLTISNYGITSYNVTKMYLFCRVIFKEIQNG